MCIFDNADALDVASTLCVALGYQTVKKTDSLVLPRYGTPFCPSMDFNGFLPVTSTGAFVPNVTVDYTKARNGVAQVRAAWREADIVRMCGAHTHADERLSVLCVHGTSELTDH